MTQTIQRYPVLLPGHVHPGKGKGYEGRDLSRFPRNSLKCSKAFSGPIIDPSEYEDRIREKTANKSWITDICDLKGVTVKDQQNSNYCWIHAPVHGMEVWYCLSGGLLLPLSAFYAGALIQGGRNSGGSGIVGVKWLSENGTCLESLHGSMNFSTRNSQEAIDNAKLHRIESYEELDDPNDSQALISSVLMDQAVTVGIPRESHEQLITKLVFDKSAFSWNYGVGYVADNSWSTNFGTNGRAVLSRAYSYFDEAGIITNCTPAIQ